MEETIRMNVWIDLGAWKGTSTQFFLDYYPEAASFKCLLVEPDTDMCRKYLGGFNKDMVTVLNAAAWKFDGQKSFYVGKHGRGSSLFGNKTTGKLKSEPVLVPTVDIQRIIKSFNINDNIVMKMNIEGAEYELLQYLHHTGCMPYIKKLYVSWHWSKIGIPKVVHKRIVMQTMIDTDLHPWNLQESKEGIATIENNSWFKDTI